MEDCIFCKIIAGEVPAHIIRRNGDIVTFLSLDGHPLIVPAKHVPDIFAIEPDVAAHIMREAVTLANALREATGCDGINLVQSNGPAAGQDVFHFHLHIKPRWKDDGVTLSWNTDTVEDHKRHALAEKLRQICNPQAKTLL